MQVTCPGCQSRFQLPEGVQPGARLRCSVCGTVFVLPGESGAQVPPAASAPGASAAAPEPRQAPQAPGGAGLPAAPEVPEAPGLPEAPGTAGQAGDAGEGLPEARRGGWAAWLLALALAAGACLCIAWQVSEGFREAVMGRAPAAQKQPAGPSAAGPSTAAPAPDLASPASPPAQAGGVASPPAQAGGVASPAAPGASAEADGKDAAMVPDPQAGAPAGIEKLSLQNVRQYFVENKKVGRILVVEGAVRNHFDEPRSAIRVEAVLIGKDKKVVEAKRQTAGAQLSHFQLQVMDKVEMEAALASEADIRLTNANVPTGGEVPFMVLFYNPSTDVAEFAAKILEARHPAR